MAFRPTFDGDHIGRRVMGPSTIPPSYVGKTSLRILGFLSRPRALVLLAVLFFAAVALGEHDWRSLPFVAAVAVAIAAAFMTLTLRPQFSVLAAIAVLAVATIVSAAKMKFMGVALHVLDGVFYLAGGDGAGFLLTEFPVPVALAGVITAGGIAAAVVVHRREARVARSRLAVAAVVPIALAGAVAAYPEAAKEPLGTYYFGYHLTSSLFTSLRDLTLLAGDPPFAGRLGGGPAVAPYSDATACTASTDRPDIVVALMESAFPPGLYPGLKAPAGLDAGMAAPDGTIHGLGVETFGGGTWITTAGLFTGLPMTAMGWMRPYVPYFLRGRVNHSLATALEKCGYDTMVVSPLAYGFVQEGPFLSSIGFRDYRDWKSIGAASKHERDTVYFDATLTRIRAHRAATDRPLLVFVMTMAAHSPYDERFAPQVKIDGEPFGNDAETDEFLRRESLQQRDFAAFSAALAAEPGRHGTVVLDFGDHQPIVTRPLAEAVTPRALEDWGSIAYLTYWRIAAYGRKLAASAPTIDRLDVGYLGPTLLEAAGIPLDEVYRELARLRDRCGGLYERCPDREAVDRHLKRLSAARLLVMDERAR